MERETTSMDGRTQYCAEVNSQIGLYLPRNLNKKSQQAHLPLQIDKYILKYIWKSKDVGQAKQH